MPQPFPEKDFIYSHKGVPEVNSPKHLNDVRYNFMPNSWPRRHFVQDFRIKVYNFSELDSSMHYLGWNDFSLDYQVADPMDSNHYINGRSPSFAILGIIFIAIYIISKYRFCNYSLPYVGLWYHQYP
jgi:hypothetical protein